MKKNNAQKQTIAAPATAIGGGSIAVVRVSGEQSIEIVNTIFSGRDLRKMSGYQAAFGKIQMPDGQDVDQVVVLVFREPHSYSGENSVEISCHGNVFSVEKILTALINAGARMAEPGEFTRRAFMNEKMDMTQAEAIADLISAETALAYDNAYLQLKGILKNNIDALITALKEVGALLELELDFSEEDISFVKSGDIADKIRSTKALLQSLADSFNAAKIMREGIRLAIIGKPNTGKSSLLNAFVKHERAIVSHIPGTTRDTVEEAIHFGRLLVRVIDTAGIRSAQSPVEQMGVQRSKKALSESGHVLFVFDVSEPLGEEDDRIIESEIASFTGNNASIVANKCDRDNNPETFKRLKELNIPIFEVSAKNGTGINELQFHVEQTVLSGLNLQREEMVVTNVRHKAAIEEATGHLDAALRGLADGAGNELVADDIRRAIESLEIILGKITSADILNTLFAGFCIGK